jgi:hypothetical protein
MQRQIAMCPESDEELKILISKLYLNWIALSVLNCSSWRSSKDHASVIDPVLLQEVTLTKLTLFMLDNSY